MTFRISPSRAGEPTWAESMTIRSPRRAGVARVDERLTGVVERPDALGVALFVAFLAVAFLAVAFLAVAFLAVAFLAVDFLAVDFLAVDFLAVDFLAGMTRLLNLTAPLRLRLSLAGRRATRIRLGALRTRRLVFVGPYLARRCLSPASDWSRSAWQSPHHEALRERLSRMLTAFGVLSLTFMMVMYALERRGPTYTAGFAVGCALSSAYGFLSGAWPFGIVEAVWTIVAARRFLRER
jgi:hypothetical protein